MSVFLEVLNNNILKFKKKKNSGANELTLKLYGYYFHNPPPLPKICLEYVHV